MGSSWFQSSQNWRIIARCSPESGGCGQSEWALEWRPDLDDGWPVTVNHLLSVPWLQKADRAPLLANKAVDVCISFDVFDKAGQPHVCPRWRGLRSGFDRPE